MAGNVEDESPRVNPYDEQARIDAQRGPRFNEYRPMEELSRKDILDLDSREKKLVEEALTDSVLTPFLTFSTELNSVVEGASAKKYLYSSQNSLERMMYSIAQTEGQIYSAHSERNEVVLGVVLAEQVREKSALTIHNWALPYLSMYWDGMGSLRILSERGAQLPMADMDRFYKGPKAKWVSDGIKNLIPEAVKAIPLATLKKGKKEEETDDGILVTETLEIRETFGDRLARYTSDSDFWTRVRGEMNTYNPLLGGKEKEKLYISEAMQQFVADFSTLQPRIKEDGSKERKMPPKKLTLYFDENGKQIEQLAFFRDASGQEQPLITNDQIKEKERNGETVIWKPGRALTTQDKKTELFVDNLDYFNKSRSENERRWVIATTAAMCIENAKQILDSLPHDVNQADGNSDANKIYKTLIQNVNNKAIEIMENYDVFRKSLLEQKIAMTAFNLSYAMSFGTFSVADMGWSYGWELKKNQNGSGFIWTAEGSQGDPTASGDSFTARRPYFHEVTYAAVKNRVSATNAGPMMAVDSTKVDELANSLLSEAEEINQRGVMVERMKRGEQPHIARYFGVLGAFESDLQNVPAWQEGAKVRSKVNKKANPNLIKTIEESVMFVPTPFKDTTGTNLYYPMITPQFQIGLFDMLSVGKDISVGDLLRKTWKKVEEVGSDGERYEKLIEANPSDGGKRLTQKDVDWNQYAAYADDGRAVNDNFLSQIYTPLYGALNGKNVEAMISNPVAAITGIIKAVDIGARKYIKKLKDGSEAKRPSFEIMYGSSIIFQNLALGVHGLIGRGSVEKYKDFIREITPGEKKDRALDNLYTILRSVEDFLPSKQGYDHYSDSFYLTLLAMAESLEPIVVASDQMAHNTTQRMSKADTTDLSGWNRTYDKNKDL